MVDADGTEEEAITFSQHLACTHCGLSFEDPSPRNFSFNSPYGACPACTGLGTRFEVDPDLVVPDPTKSLAEGALAPWSGARSEYFNRMVAAVAELGGFSLDDPWEKLRKADRKLILYGAGHQAGPPPVPQPLRPPALLPHPLRGHRPLAAAPPHRGRVGLPAGQPRGLPARGALSRCAAGPGSGPSRWPSPSAGYYIFELCSLSIGKAVDVVAALELSDRDHLIADRVFREVRERMQFLLDVGLDYLTLARSAATLSGGEAQRIRLASQIGSGLVGVLYVLDEPSIGLHQRDNQRLIGTLKRLRDLGNTVIVVEHDEETIRVADHVVDVGPGGGRARRPHRALGSGHRAGRARVQPGLADRPVPLGGQVHPRPRRCGGRAAARC